jgi:site-specific DNA-methyltransferase (adenine-specific)
MSEINFFNVDCVEFMKSKPDNYYDLAIVDPPYGLERFKKGGSHINKYGTEKQQWNNEKPSKEYFNELFRISKNQIIWGGNNFDLPTSEYFIIWQKGNAEDFSFAMCEMAWTNCKVPAKIYTKYHVSCSDERIHPTQKPTDLYRWLLSKYAKQGQKILDTHGGSMSSAIAADKEGFDLDICEIDSDYFNAGVKRYKLHKRQTVLF